jgi:hypothetical protein
VRTTVTLEPDVEAAVTELRRARGLGLSEALNELVRAGLAAHREGRVPVRLGSGSLGLRVDVSNVAEALDVAEGPGAR